MLIAQLSPCLLNPLPVLMQHEITRLDVESDLVVFIANAEASVAQGSFFFQRLPCWARDLKMSIPVHVHNPAARWDRPIITIPTAYKLPDRAIAEKTLHGAPPLIRMTATGLVSTAVITHSVRGDSLGVSARRHVTEEEAGYGGGGFWGFCFCVGVRGLFNLEKK